MERVVFDRMAELDQEHWWFLARRRILETLIAREVRPPEKARILEVGCGTGHNLPMLSRFGQVQACELDDSARALAAKRFGHRIEAAKLPDLSPFDA
ncbi:MAG TPA: SAM-dependent methyltransferase, partial [Sphingomicrobium sp.]|nr:SAM-dependent methyltransferase [Sphingomicrobium sp.]